MAEDSSMSITHPVGDLEMDGSLVAMPYPVSDARVTDEASVSGGSRSEPRHDSGVVTSLGGDDLETDDGACVPHRYVDMTQSQVYRKDTAQTSNIDKHPVQCTDDSDEIMSSLDYKFNNFSLTEKEINDEGIGSMSLSNPPSLQEEMFEVDLLESDEDGDTILHVAILKLKETLAIALIELAEDVEDLNTTNNLLQTPLHLAVITEQAEIVKSLLSRNVDIWARDHQGNTALHIACRIGEQDSVSMLIASFGKNEALKKKYFAVKNCEGLTCLHLATERTEYTIMGHLFARGADVNMADTKSGRTILHYAVERNDIQTVSLLLTHHDIDIDCKTYKGETPLFMAYWRNYRDILRHLKKKGGYFSYDVVEISDDEEY